jgi:hypothetical protein
MGQLAGKHAQIGHDYQTVDSVANCQERTVLSSVPASPFSLAHMATLLSFSTAVSMLRATVQLCAGEEWRRGLHSLIGGYSLTQPYFIECKHNV